MSRVIRRIVAITILLIGGVTLIGTERHAMLLWALGFLLMAVAGGLMLARWR